MKVPVFLVLLCAMGCGGSGGDGADPTPVPVVLAPTPAPTPIEVTECGDVTVDVTDVPPIEEAAADAGVTVTDNTPAGSTEVGVDQGAALKSVIIASCGSTVVNDESTTVSNTTVIHPTPTPATPAEKLIAEIQAGHVASVEIRP